MTLSNQDGQEVHDHWEGDDNNGNKGKESPSRAEKEEKDDKADSIVLGNQMLITDCPPPTVEDEIQEMFLRLGFSQTVNQKLVKDEGIDSAQTLGSLSDEDISVIYEVIRRSGVLVSGMMPGKRNHIPYCWQRILSSLHSCSR